MFLCLDAACFICHNSILCLCSDAAHSAGRGVSEDHRAPPRGAQERGHGGSGRHCPSAICQGGGLPEAGGAMSQRGELLQGRHCEYNHSPAAVDTKKENQSTCSYNQPKNYHNIESASVIK